MKISKKELSESREIAQAARAVYNEKLREIGVPLNERIKRMSALARLINVAECMLGDEQINVTK